MVLSIYCACLVPKFDPVCLPSLIAHTNMDQDAISILKDHLAQFLGYLVKFQKELFLEEYESATPQYLAAQKNI